MATRKSKPIDLTLCVSYLWSILTAARHTFPVNLRDMHLVRTKAKEIFLKLMAQLVVALVEKHGFIRVHWRPLSTACATS